jgi:hypothetical protein
MRPHDDDNPIGECDECGSPFIRSHATMSGLCRECAHWLYSKPACDHEFLQGVCRYCGWDGSTSDYIRSLRNDEETR